MPEDFPELDFQPGQEYYATVEFWAYEVGGGKIHIVSTIDEGLGVQVVYRAFGKHKRWWHYFVESKRMLEFHINQANKTRSEPGFKPRSIGLAGFNTKK